MKDTSMTRRLVLAISLAIPTLAMAQTPPAPGGGTGAQAMVRAAGMPLQDGTLAPGSLTVRIVQGDFTGNLSGIDVDLEVAGEGAKRAQTGADGRAAFAHLPIGASVTASATVNGERLQSEPFTMPADAGIRLLFVAGGAFVDTATAAGAQAIPPITGAPPVGANAMPPGSAAAPSAAGAGTGVATTSATDSVATFRIVMIALTAIAFAAVAWGRVRGRK
jgi:hypothetical protein